MVAEVTVGPDDKLVILCDSPISDESCKRLQSRFEEALKPGTRVIVLTDGLKLAVLHMHESVKIQNNSGLIEATQIRSDATTLPR